MIRKYKKVISFILILGFLILSIIPIINTSAIDSNYVTLPSAPYEYYTYPKMTQLLIDLEKNNSDIMSVDSIGTTYEGRDIWVVKLSDNVELEEDEPSVLFMGAHHGDEKPGFEVLIFFIKYMIEKYGAQAIDDDNDGAINEDPFDGIDNDQDGAIDEDPSEEQVTNAIHNTQIFIIPMVNPDGVEANTRKNCAPNYGPDGKNNIITSYGVDLNRNYGYAWNYPYLFPEEYYLEYLIADDSGIYRGETPFCENETKAVKNFIENHNIGISLSYHDYGEWMVFPWMHSSMHTPHEALFRSIGRNMSKINKYELKIYGQSGTQEYLIPRLCGTPGSSENWLYGEHEIISYTVELCKRRAERMTSLVLNACWKHVGVNLYICERSIHIQQEKNDYYMNPQLSQFIYYLKQQLTHPFEDKILKQ